jgi:hypothetical protein
MRKLNFTIVKNNYKKILTIIFTTIFVLLLWYTIDWLFFYRHPIEYPSQLTDYELDICLKVKPEFNSALIIQGNLIYWTMKSGQVKVCVNNRILVNGMSINNN